VITPPNKFRGFYGPKPKPCNPRVRNIIAYGLLKSQKLFYRRQAIHLPDKSGSFLA